MKFNQVIQSYWFPALTLLVSTLTLVVTASGSDSNPLVQKGLHDLDQSIQKQQKDLAEYKEAHHLALNRAPVEAQEGRALAQEKDTTSTDQAQRETDSVNDELHKKEVELEHTVKKRDYISSVQGRLTTSNGLSALQEENNHLIHQLVSELKPLEYKLGALSKTCSECKVLILVGDREPANSPAKVTEFHRLLRQRNDLEDQLETANIQSDALRDLQTTQIGMDSIDKPHRLGNGAPPASVR